MPCARFPQLSQHVRKVAGSAFDGLTGWSLGNDSRRDLNRLGDRHATLSNNLDAIKENDFMAAKRTRSTGKIHSEGS
jgi:hypothetical protein